MAVLKHFALIDCAVEVPTTCRALRKQVEQASVRAECLFANQPERDLSHAGPWLVALGKGAEGSGIEAWLDGLARRRQAVSWLTSYAEFDALFAHLEKHIDIRLPDGALAMHRFWDPRAWVRLQRILTEEQRIEFMGPIIEWRTMSRGELYCASQDEGGVKFRRVIVDADTHA